jgi:YVTN family beta-propeller protein
VLSSSTRELVEDELPEGVFVRDLGLVRLKDLERPERIWQLAGGNLRLEFPPLRGAQRVKEARMPRRRSLLVAMLAGVVAAAVAVPVFALGSGSGKALTRLQANAVGAINPSTGSLVRSVPVGGSPDHVAFGAGAIWAANSATNTVTRIDPKGKTASQVPIQVGNDPSGIAVGGGSVWVANALDGTVSRINTVTNQVVGKPIPVGNGPRGVAYFHGAVWVALLDDRQIARIYPSGRVKHFPVPAGPEGMAAGAGYLWASNPAEGTVTRIDPATRQTVTVNVGHGPGAVTVGDGAVWVANSLDSTVSRIGSLNDNPHEVAVIPVGDGPSGVAVTADGVLVANEGSQTISRIDPRNNVPTTLSKVGNRPQGLAVASDLAWVGVDAGTGVHTGGTLRILNNWPGIPLAGFDPTVGPLLSTLMFDGLTMFRRVSGTGGFALEPDLATALPTPTKGTTYTFRLRRLIHYSTGALVRPEDVRRGIERMFALGTATYLTGIVGAARCTARPGSCDLSRGITTNDHDNTVTIHLVAPDPEFLDKLAVGAFVVPAGTPVGTPSHPITKLPLAATGPYMIRSATPNVEGEKRIELVPNPHFNAWSPWRPRGYLDRILILNKENLSVTAVLRAIEHGHADYSFSLGNSEITHSIRQKLATRYPELLKTLPAGLGFSGLELNTTMAPFNHQAVRRAISYAIDRRHALRLWPHSASLLTCQVLDPGFSSYKRYCPYTVNRTPQGAPNLRKAQALVNGSGTRGTRVTLTTDPVHTAIAGYLAKVLDRLGYPTHLRVRDLDNWGNPQAAITFGFAADYPAPADFFLLFKCGSPPFLATHFCSHKIDRLIARAEHLQASQPDQANRIWTKLDRQITDQAPEVFLFDSRYDVLISKRVRNFQSNDFYGVLFDQLWVK